MSITTLTVILESLDHLDTQPYLTDLLLLVILIFLDTLANLLDVQLVPPVTVRFVFWTVHESMMTT